MFIFQKFEYCTILFKNHAILRMLERGISKSQIIEIIEQGIEIEDYPTDFPYPSKLIYNNNNENPLHAVLALNKSESQIIVVTLYIPDVQHFEKDWITRKEKL